MNGWRRLAAIGPVILSTFFVTGCWDYQKINDRAQIIGIAVDPVDNQSDQLSYTLQTPVFAIGHGTSGGGGQADQQGGQGASTQQFRNFRVRAEGVSEAMSKAQMQYDKMLYLGNLQTVLLSKELSYDQVRKVITELIRIPSVDRLAWVVFSDGLARSIFEKQAGGAPSDSLDRIFGSNLKQHGYATRSRLWEYWRDMNGAGIAPHCAMVKTTKDGLQVFGVRSLASGTEQVELKPEDTIYYNFLEGRVQRISLWIPETTPQGKRRFEIGDIRSDSYISASMKGSKTQLKVRIRAKAIVHQDATDAVRTLTTADLARYQTLAEQYIQDHAMKVLKQFQKQRVDAFGFGAYLMTQQPRTYPLVVQKWSEQFEKAMPDIQVHLTLVQKGSLM